MMDTSGKTGFYVGGYAEPGQRGILKCVLADGHVTVLDFNDELRNPSWVLAHPDRPLLYAVEEFGPEGRLAALGPVDGHLRVLGRWPTRGADPCHLSLSPNGRHLFVANYTGGSLAMYALDGEGMPAGLTDFRQHTLSAERRGRGNSERQEAAHVHFTLCDGQQVYVCDLGQDRVLHYGWDGASGRLRDEGRAIDFPEGSGPRHLALSGDGRRLYVLCELNATLHVFQRLQEGWRRAQVISTVPKEFEDYERYSWSAGAAIHFDGERTLCASTRGHDSIAVFRVDGAGLLTDRCVLPAGGRTPRDFLPTAEGLLTAGQDDNCLCLLRREGEGYAPARRCLEALRPTCLCGFTLRD